MTSTEQQQSVSSSPIPPSGVVSGLPEIEQVPEAEPLPQQTTEQEIDTEILPGSPSHDHPSDIIVGTSPSTSREHSTCTISSQKKGLEASRVEQVSP